MEEEAGSRIFYFIYLFIFLRAVSKLSVSGLCLLLEIYITERKKKMLYMYIVLASNTYIHYSCRERE